MKQKICSKAIAVCITVLLLFQQVTMTSYAAFGDWITDGSPTIWTSGDGSAEDPWQIERAQHLAYLAQQVNGGNKYATKYFILTANIDLEDHYWIPIGSSTTNVFQGIFDGNNKSITNLYIGTSAAPNTDLDGVGLFGFVGSGAIIKDLGVDVALYNNKMMSRVGGLTAYIVSASVDNCYTTGTVSGVGMMSAVAGFIGSNNGSANITNCYSTVDVSYGAAWGAKAGGFIGDNDGSSIANCYAMGDVTGTGTSVNTAVGGFIGYSYQSISNCYATGNTQGGADAYVGGFIGDVRGGTIVNAYWNSDASQTVNNLSRADVNKQGAGNGTDATTSLTSVQMSSAAEGAGALIDTLNANKSDSHPTWLNWTQDGANNNGYPTLTSSAPSVPGDEDTDYTISFNLGSDDYIIGADHFDEISDALAVCTDDGDDDVLTIQLGSSEADPLPIWEIGTDLLDINALISATYMGWIEIQRWAFAPEEGSGYGVNIPNTVNVIFDGVEIIDDIESGNEFNYDWDFYTIKVSEGGSLHLKGGSTVLSGKNVSAVRNDSGILSITDGYNITMKTTNCVAVDNVGGTVTVNNETGTILILEDDSYTCRNLQGGVFNVVAGTISTGEQSSYAFLNEANSVLNISGGIVETTDISSRTILNYEESTLNITGGTIRSIESDSYVIYISDSTMNMSGGNISCSATDEEQYAIRINEGTAEITGGIIESGTFNIRLQDTDENDQAWVKLWDTTIYSSAMAEIYIEGVDIEGKYTLKSDNYENASLNPVDYDDGMTFQWASNAARNEIISDVLRPTISSLITGDNAGVTQIYLAKVILPFDPSFESGLSSVTVADGQIVENELIVDNSEDDSSGPVWTVQSNGSKMLSLSPTDSYYLDDDAEDLEVSDEGYDYLLDQFNYDFYDMAYMYVDKEFDENEEFSMAWQYVSTDYAPYNDGSFASFVNLDDSSSIPLINGVRADVSILGATVPGTGNYSTGDYGATGWQTVIFKANAAGTYRIGFVIFNLEDEEYSPWLFVDDAAGVTLKDEVPFEAIEKDENAPPPAGEVVEEEDDVTAPSLTAGAVNRTSDTAGTVKFTSNEAGSYYYAVVTDGAEEPSIDTTGGGTACTTSETTITNPTGLTTGAKDIYIKVKDAAGNVSNALKLDIPVYTPSDDNSNGGTVTIPDSPPDNGTDVDVNGQSYSAGTTKTTTNADGQTQTTVTVDTDRLDAILAQQGQGATVTIPVITGADVAAGVLTGDMVDAMEENGATLIIDTDNATYTLPASEIDINAISEQFGEDVSLADIIVTVSVSTPSDDMVTVIADAANEGGFTLVVPAVEFTVSCTYGDQTVDVTSFEAYVDRTILIPDGVDPNQITTAIVVDPDGTRHSVPTEIVYDTATGQYYALIHSLTNSVYSVIYNPVEFADVKDNWAKDSINNMGSRMVVTGVDGNKYEPDREITRAEFAAIVVRALGLKQGLGTSIFSDIKSTDWYCGYVETAVRYNLIMGYDDGTFRPIDKITRQEAMAIIARAMVITKLNPSLTDDQITDLLSGYSDSASASSWADASIAACLKTGVISGRTSTTLSPTANITRAEVAVIVERLLVKSELI